MGEHDDNFEIVYSHSSHEFLKVMKTTSELSPLPYISMLVVPVLSLT